MEPSVSENSSKRSKEVDNLVEDPWVAVVLGVCVVAIVVAIGWLVYDDMAKRTKRTVAATPEDMESLEMKKLHALRDISMWLSIIAVLMLTSFILGLILIAYLLFSGFPTP